MYSCFYNSWGHAQVGLTAFEVLYTPDIYLATSMLYMIYAVVARLWESGMRDTVNAFFP